MELRLYCFLYRWVRLLQEEVSWVWHKIASDGDALEMWEVWSTSSLPLLPDPLWLREVLWHSYRLALVPWSILHFDQLVFYKYRPYSIINKLPSTHLLSIHFSFVSSQLACHLSHSDASFMLTSLFLFFNGEWQHDLHFMYTFYFIISKKLLTIITCLALTRNWRAR